MAIRGIHLERDKGKRWRSMRPAAKVMGSHGPNRLTSGCAEWPRDGKGDRERQHKRRPAPNRTEIRDACR